MRYRVLPVRNTRHKNEVLAALLSDQNGMCGIVYCDTQATTPLMWVNESSVYATMNEEAEN